MRSRKKSLDEYGDPIIADCIICGVSMPKWEPQYCCRGAIDYCDCDGRPINEPICKECEDKRENEEDYTTE